MEWRESQLQPGILEVQFPAAQAEALHAACLERTTQRAQMGNSPLEFDERLIRLTDNVPPDGSVSIEFDGSALDAVSTVSKEFAARTSQAAVENNDGLHVLQQRIQGLKRCDLGVAALTLSMEAQSAEIAYSTNFHGKLDAFLRLTEQGGID